MNTIVKTAVVFAFLALFAVGCLGLKQPGRKIDYYTLEYDSPEITGLKPIPIIIRLERFTVAPLYNSNRIVYKEKEFRRDTYLYHKWRANPGDLVTYFLARDLRQTDLFKAVTGVSFTIPSSYHIEGIVDEFFEEDEENSWKAVLSVNITLIIDNEPDISKRVVFQKRYNAVEECKKKNPHALAEGMSAAMFKISQKIISDIYQHVAKRSFLSR